jgi:hypothetical protein
MRCVYSNFNSLNVSIACLGLTIFASGSTGLPAKKAGTYERRYLCVSLPQNSADGWAASSFSYIIACSCLFTPILLSLEFTGP